VHRARQEGEQQHSSRRPPARRYSIVICWLGLNTSW
jgi:hypothetical protein